MKSDYLNETILYLKCKVGVSEAAKIQNELDKCDLTAEKEMLFWHSYLKYRRRILVRNLMIGMFMPVLLYLAFLFYNCPVIPNSCLLTNYSFIFVIWIIIGTIVLGITQLYFSRLCCSEPIGLNPTLPLMVKVMNIIGINHKKVKP